jgi:hypothetical protein
MDRSRNEYPPSVFSKDMWCSGAGMAGVEMVILRVIRFSINYSLVLALLSS